MAKKHLIPWFEAERFLEKLETGERHDIEIQREAIPLVFIPGIMGTHLRRTGTDGTGETDGVPNMRWNPSATGWVLKNLVFSNGAERRRLIIGTPQQRFRANYLEPDEANPPGDGWQGIMTAYHVFLERLRARDWGHLSKYFEFPVYALGFNWTADIKGSAPKRLERIDEIIKESEAITGYCKQVILITHSMGGLMARSITELAGGRAKVAGIVHGVQPVHGAPTAYWRMKAGFEGFDSLGLVQRALGNDGPKVTSVLGNIPGGLQLLPNKVHQTNDKKKEWLTITEDGKTLLALPDKDPYEEIYRVPAEPKPLDEAEPSTNRYWGLVDPSLLNPERPKKKGGDENDALASALNDDWPIYLENLKLAEELHDALNPAGAPPAQHPQTLCVTGIGHKTVDVVKLEVESRVLPWFPDPYPNQGFVGSFRDGEGKRRQAKMHDPDGEGDGTVVLSSGIGVCQDERPSPGDRRINVEHQPAYESTDVQDWAIEAIEGIVKYHYYDKRKAPAAE